MKYNVEVKTSLKKGMLNPEATTIQKALALLEYDVEDTKTSSTIMFKMQAENREDAYSQAEQMCQKLLCNPVIHDYEIIISEE